jgi:flagellar hook-length control protein FliK
MRRLFPVVALAAWWLASGSAGNAWADKIDDQVKDLRSGNSYKVRLSAVLALSKAFDPRAIKALTGALDSDSDASIRRIAALGLGRVVEASSETDAKNGALAALDHASKHDKDTKVRDSAQKSLDALASVRAAASAKASGKASTAPPVFVTVDEAVDISKRASASTSSLTKVVKGTVKNKGYAVEWPGGLPTQQELTASGARAFIIGATVKSIEITPKGTMTEVACSVAIRIAPWTGSDGKEQWEANKAGSATGNAKAVTGSGDRAVAGGIRDCVVAVGEEVTARQVVPFIKRLATP